MCSSDLGEGAAHADEDALVARLAELVDAPAPGVLRGIGDDAKERVGEVAGFVESFLSVSRGETVVIFIFARYSRAIAPKTRLKHR